MPDRIVTARTEADDGPNTGPARERRERVAQILADPEISELIRESRTHRKNIERAAELLQSEPDAVAAVRKAAQGLVREKIKVFLSYKEKEEKTAEGVVGALLAATGKLDIAYMADIPHGTRYRDWINEQTGNAHWFILLLPDPSEGWDWCLYESGLFKARMLSCDRLICLYHPKISERPGALEEFNHIPATLDSVAAFLREVFIRGDALAGMDPLNEHADIPAMAKSIVEAVSPPAEKLRTCCLTPYVTLEVLDGQTMSMREELDDARLLDAQVEIPAIFGKLETPGTWKELVANLCNGNGDPPWIEDLRCSIGAVLEGNRVETGPASFRAAHEEKAYRAHVHEVTRTAGGRPKAIQILFVEDISALSLSPEHDTVATLAMLLRMAFRLRWEVLEQYGHGSLKPEDLKSVQTALDRLQAEARASGRLEAKTMLELFDHHQQAVIIRMMAKWSELRREDGSGALDVALREGDATRAGELLAALSPLNKEFLVMASRRFAELTEQVQA